jgi:hypothetical protein
MLTSGDSLLRIGDEHLSYEIFGGLRDLVPLDARQLVRTWNYEREIYINEVHINCFAKRTTKHHKRLHILVCVTNDIL